ncbi:MAG: sulfurtransferase complex subunit TusB [Candidatus Endonucleobacter bathymodioli]|uniref:Sulfurtransferase complex subunit TusB n=1 Tax=Candidatus Endonucleibacter bathymodioli TaxID=539814 RepID=A0AA90NYW4_9GAMM|nr:sulfurtransferase complex subunit TusB [Candidatus Endonucleobacter bathymodioli]
MAILHLINKPGEPINLCQRTLTSGDGILLLEDGIYLLNSNTSLLSTLTENHSIYFLDNDHRARGTLVHVKNIIAVDYAQFVDLTICYDHVISWF